MALRDTLRKRCQPLLASGERIEQIFLAQTGPSPYWLFLTYLVFFWVNYKIIAVTDQGIVIFRASAWAPAKPKEIEARLAPQALGPLSGLWGKMELNRTRFHVHKRFHKDAAAADLALRAA